MWNPIKWAVEKLKPDFNNNGEDDIKELQAAIDKLGKEIQHAVDTLDYKTILVHLTDIAEAIQKIQFFIGEIQKAVTTPEVKAAAIALKEASEAFLVLLKSFSDAHKVALIDKGGDVA